MYARNSADPRHERAAEVVEKALNGPRRVGLPWQTLRAFLCIATQPRVFPAPLSTDAAAEASGVPRSTLRHWLDDPEMAPYRHKAREALAEEMTVIARLAAQKLAEAIRRGDLEPRDLIMAAGMATDKSQLLTGQATGRLETRDLTDTLDDHERATLRDILDGVLAETATAGPGGDAA